MVEQSIQYIVDFLVYIYELFCDFGSIILNLFRYSVADFIIEVINVLDFLNILPDALLNLLRLMVQAPFFQETTFLSLMIGGGIIFYLAWQFVTWILNVVT